MRFLYVLYRVLRGKACQAVVFYRYLPRFVSEGGGCSSISIGFYRESTGKSSIFIAYSGGNVAFYMFCIAYCGGKHVRQRVFVGIYRVLSRRAADVLRFSSGFTAKVAENRRFSSRIARGIAFLLCFVSRFARGSMSGSQFLSVFTTFCRGGRRTFFAFHRVLPRSQ